MTIAKLNKNPHEPLEGIKLPSEITNNTLGIKINNMLYGLYKKDQKF